MNNKDFTVESNDCKLIAFDSSTTRTGYALYVNGKLKEHGTFDHSNEKDTLIRMEDMMISIRDYILKHKPDILVIERPPLVKDPNTLINLAEIVGVVRGLSLSVYAEYVEYMPNSWRKHIAGDNEKIPIARKEAKPWDIKKVRDEFGIEKGSNGKALNDDEADAILIGLARVKEIAKIEDMQKKAG